MNDMRLAGLHVQVVEAYICRHAPIFVADQMD
jgi:hypothetical protein